MYIVGFVSRVTDENQFGNCFALAVSSGVMIDFTPFQFFFTKMGLVGHCVLNKIL